MNLKAYWEHYYNDPSQVGTQSYQRNVGRTTKGEVVSAQTWNRTLEYIRHKLMLNEQQDIAELCCGNGEVVGNLAPFCRRAVGVDYSPELLRQMQIKYGASVEAVKANVLDLKIGTAEFDAIVVYFSIQHFSERDTILLVEKALSALKSKGRLLIGDIPDQRKKWTYISTPEYRANYIQREVEKRPMIGYWYHPDFFKALGDYFNLKTDIFKQPDYQINSSYRFDVMIHKED